MEVEGCEESKTDGGGEDWVSEVGERSLNSKIQNAGASTVYRRAVFLICRNLISFHNMFI